MNSTALFAQIKILLYRLADDIESSNALHLQNDAIHAENFLCELLNFVFSWNLENGNRIKLNQDTFDLIDNQNKIYIQVTSNKSHQTKYNKVIKDLSKQGSKTKYHTFYLFFISQKVDKPFLAPQEICGTHYEGWDMTRLSDYIFYEKKSALKLKPIYDLLNQELNVLPPNSNGMVPIKSIALPQQLLQAVQKDKFYVNRQSLVTELYNFTQENSGLITGGPGFGKSFTIAELQRHFQSLKIPCFVIRINELIKGKSAELSAELGTTSNWIDALKAVPSVTAGKSVLIFDAFDTAKDESFKANMLSHIKTAINQLGDNWHVIASTRSYDALKSHHLAELFPKSSTKNAIGCRFIEVSALSDTEVLTAIKSKAPLRRSYDRANQALKEMLRIPYFLGLFEQVVTEKAALNIHTEEQLLSLYWNKRINNDTSKDLFLRKLTSILSTQENLSCKKSTILVEQNVNSYEALLSDGIITETSYTRENLAFAHNILLEYALFKYAIPDTTDELIPYLQANERQPFLFRSSYIYFYSTLWSYDRDKFWQHYFVLKKIEQPLFRLIHQTILNYVLAYYYESVKDFSHIDAISDDEERSAIFCKLLEAIRFIRPHDIHKKDIYLLLHTSEDIAPLTIWEIGNLTEKAIIQYSADNKVLKVLGRISRNYINYYLQGLETPLLKMRIEGNGQHWAIRNYVRCLKVINKPKPPILKLLKLLKTEDFNIHLFYILADEINNIAKYDLSFAFLVYKTIYDYIETSDKATYMGNSVVMSLKSNRKQDFDSVHHRLESEFGELLALYPQQALVFGLKIIDDQLLHKEKYWKVRFRESININGIAATIIEDGSMYDYKLERDYGPLSHLKRIITYFHSLANEGKLTALNDLLESYLRHGLSRMVWTRLLNFLQKHADLNPAINYGLLTNSGIYSSSKSRQEIFKLIENSWRWFSFDQKAAIETTIYNLPQQEYSDDAYMSRIKGILFSCVPDGELVLDQSIKHLELTGKITGEDVSRMESSVSFNRTVAEEKQRLDIRDEMVSEHEAFTLIKKVEEFNDSHIRIQNRPKPVPKDYKPYLKTVKELYHLRSDSYPEKLLEGCDMEIAHYLSLVLQNFKKVPTDLKLWAEKVAFEFLDEPRYLEEYQAGDLSTKYDSWSPSPRTYATGILMSLSYQDKKLVISDKLLLLMRDVNRRVRFKALRMLPNYYKPRSEQYWSTVTDRMQSETDGHCLHEVIHALYYKDVISENTQKVVDALWLASNRIHEIKVSDDLEKMYVYLLVEIICNHENQSALELLKHNSFNEDFCREFVWRTFGILDSKNKEKKVLLGAKSERELYTLIEDFILWQFEMVSGLELNDPKVSGPLHTIDLCVQQLFFKVDKDEKGKSKQAVLKGKKDYLQQVKPLLSLILTQSKHLKQGFMVAHSAYYLMQLLNYMLPADPVYILELASDTVVCASANNFTYDHTTMKETMKLAERLLADYKGGLKDRTNFNRLLTILDHFANSGWVEALELIWKLKEIF